MNSDPDDQGKKSENEKITGERVDRAVASFAGGHRCSQAVLEAFAGDLGLDRELALKLGCPFGGGMARTGETCGAVTGALMVIGLKFGRVDVGDSGAVELTDERVSEFFRRFKSRHESLVCRELIGCEISTPEGQEFAAQNNVFDKICRDLVKDAAEILQDIL